MSVERRYEWAFVLVLAGLALALRLALIGASPPGIRFDELVNIKMAERIYAGERPIYFQEAWGHEPLYHYLHALGMLIWGQNVLGIRIVSIFFGVLGVLTAYLVFRRFFGRTTAGVASLLLAVSFWSMLYSRFGERHISLPVWLGLAIYGFWRGLETPLERRRRLIGWFTFGGACVGAGLYTYFAGRLAPILFGLFVLYLALFHRPMLKGRWIGLLVFFVLPIVMVAPMALYLYRHPELETRLGQVGGEIWAAIRAGNWPLLAGYVVDTLKMFSVRGDPEWLYNISGRPVFDGLTAVPFYAGVLLALWRWRTPRCAFILLWLVVGLAPSVLSWPQGSLGHSIVAQPVTFVFPALALVGAYRWLADHPRWERLRPFAAALTALVVLVFAIHNLYDYYYRWPRFAEVRHEYQAPITAVSRYLDAHPDLPVAAVSAPYVDYWNPWSKKNFDLQPRRGTARVAWFNGTSSLLIPPGEAWFFLPDHINLPSALPADLDALLRAGSMLVEKDYPADRIGSTFDLYHWNDRAPLEAWLETLASAPVWAGPETVYVEGESERSRVPLSGVEFGGRLDFLGYECAQISATPGDVWQITTAWRVIDAAGGPLAIFVHLLDDQNQVRAGWDGLHSAVESWAAGDVLIHKHSLAIPADAPLGVLRVQLGVYAPDTLQRLAVSSTGGPPAPYERLLLTPLRVE